MQRRTFLKLSGLSVPATALYGCAPNESESAPGARQLRLETRHIDHSLTVYRKEDMVALTFGFVNLTRHREGEPLTRIDAAEPAYVVVSHEPQHILERTFAEDSDSTTPMPPLRGPIAGRLAGKSRVAYQVPDEVASIDLTVEDLLAAARDYPLVVGQNATPPAAPILQKTFSLTDSGIAAARLVDDDFRTVTDSDGSTLVRFDTGIVRATRGIKLLGQATGLDVGLHATAVDPDMVFTPGPPEEPGAHETSLEVPFRLEISPNVFGQWAHAVLPVKSSSDRVELWHSRLGVRGADGRAIETGSYLNTIRALWSRNDEMDTPRDLLPSEDPFSASLTPQDRVDIVRQSSDFTLTDESGDPIVPLPVTVNRLMLSALGGFMDVRGDWGSAPKFDLMLWEHRATLGRDHFVKVVRSGYLYPFGHRAAKITISERKFHPDRRHEAFLWKRTFIVIKQPVIEYTSGRNLQGVRGKLRKMPFTMVQIKTLVTPNLDNPDDNSDVYPVEVGGAPLRFECEALDSEGRLVSFTAPLVFVRGNANNPVTEARFDDATDEYDGYGDDAESDFDGQRIAFAPAKNPDDTRYETHQLAFSAVLINQDEFSDAGYEAGFLPIIDNVELAVEAVRQAADADGTRRFKYHSTFTSNGFGSDNPGEIVFELADGQSQLGVNFSKNSDKSGAFLTPSFKVSGLSRKTGPVGGPQDQLANFAQNSFDPSDFFEGLDAKLFGVIDLFDIIKADGGVENAPTFISQSLDDVETFIVDATALAADLASLPDPNASLISALTQAVADINPDPTKSSQLESDFSVLDTALSDLIAASAPSSVNQGLWLEIQRQALALQGIIDSIMPTADDLGVIGQYLAGEELPLNQRVQFEWRPQLKSFSLVGNDPLFEPDPELGSLVLSGEIRTKASGGLEAGTDLTCSLEHFTLYLIGKQTAQVTIPFDYLRFTTRAGEKSDVDVGLGEVEFGGALSFVQTLAELLPFDGTTAPSIDVDDSGISSNFSFSIPNVAIGVFSLQNISFGAGFTIPFVDDPLAFSFNFCTRENPFLLTVLMIGGGGFFGVTLGPDGVVMLEAQFEAGAELAIDFGVASGSVSIMVGVYFCMEGDECTITAFIQIHGEVDVFGGVASASITLSLDLTYHDGKLVGSASMEIEISVLFFSGSVTVEYEAKLAGSNGDPTFADAMAPSLPDAPPEEFFAPWNEYVSAFAA
ncbi:MAG TPA: hypothetical protein VGP93_03095 [Polyangiaceae bacterium]|nr:hypothetical protein [Polyangiaceae bacterium]